MTRVAVFGGAPRLWPGWAHSCRVGTQAVRAHPCCHQQHCVRESGWIFQKQFRLLPPAPKAAESPYLHLSRCCLLPSALRRCTTPTAAPRRSGGPGC